MFKVCKEFIDAYEKNKEHRKNWAAKYYEFAFNLYDDLMELWGILGNTKDSNKINIMKNKIKPCFNKLPEAVVHYHLAAEKTESSMQDLQECTKFREMFDEEKERRVFPDMDFHIQDFANLAKESTTERLLQLVPEVMRKFVGFEPKIPSLESFSFAEQEQKPAVPALTESLLLKEFTNVFNLVLHEQQKHAKEVATNLEKAKDFTATLEAVKHNEFQMTTENSRMESLYSKRVGIQEPLHRLFTLRSYVLSEHSSTFERLEIIRNDLIDPILRRYVVPANLFGLIPQ
eukprot:GHVL01038426.1.p1 GENE.GHVL01038426.1~~GHVL01038426.1.p1  ORF type:complete len:295 (-),score=41.99 GHVL01038426.1:93-956(-)